MGSVCARGSSTATVTVVAPEHPLTSLRAGPLRHNYRKVTKMKPKEIDTGPRSRRNLKPSFKSRASKDSNRGSGAGQRAIKADTEYDEPSGSAADDCGPSQTD
ncbi:unnamed protein product [Vitrella brassicaformis CCMP3155]|uniref:Uncharacterized protein n=1 Tax=Vitrella brassicaformis (strain CCMP3155) TaxID=1169540 RepID=A0A0G4EG66_VITBC|nr:unnamed protein product [Vitrella brassicaformis CCMP3155]|eukprot:CEL94465.1 unnamed protein product [Vitrella brassicaformis CCMP3155]